jgi:serine/threonine protein kinase
MTNWPVNSVEPGHVIAGKFELVRLLGRGSMGEVWVAHHRTLGENVALKLLTMEAEGGVSLDENPDAAVARFRFEAQIAARLSRKTRHIVQVTDHGEEKGVAYLVMELLDGQTLDAVLQKSGRLAPDVVADVVMQTARGLTQAHTDGVFHRDLKPANVFMTTDEEGRRLVKVLDFGIARVIHAHRFRGPFATAKGFVYGTPAYMSPEQAVASAKLDHRCDVWALGVIAFEALTGGLPADGKDVDEVLRSVCAGRMVSVRDRLPGASPELARFFDQAFAHPIDGRFASAVELAESFAAACSGLPREGATSTRRHSMTADTEPPPAPDEHELTTHVLVPQTDRKRAIPIVAAGALMALVAVGVGVWRAWPSPTVHDVAEAPAIASATPGAGPKDPAASTSSRAAHEDVEDPPAGPVASSLPGATARPLAVTRGSAVRAVTPPASPTATSPAPPAAAPAAPPRPPPKPRDKSAIL